MLEKNSWGTKGKQPNSSCTTIFQSSATMEWGLFFFRNLTWSTKENWSKTNTVNKTKFTTQISSWKQNPGEQFWKSEAIKSTRQRQILLWSGMNCIHSAINHDCFALYNSYELMVFDRVLDLDDGNWFLFYPPYTAIFWPWDSMESSLGHGNITSTMVLLELRHGLLGIISWIPSLI